MSELQVGWAKREITPQSGYAMAGYIARRGTSLGVLDPLYVRALLLRQDTTQMVLVLADILMISSRCAGRLQRRIAALLNIRPEFVIVAATHTHSGPLVDMYPFNFSGGQADPHLHRYARKLEEAMLSATVEASRRVRTAGMSFARIEVESVASDRNRPKQARRQNLFVFKFKTEEEVALLGIYGCHPTVLGADNHRFSGDLHGAVSRMWEAKASIALVANGAAANISTRFTRRRQTAKEVNVLASRIVRKAFTARFKKISLPQLNACSQIVILPLTHLKSTVPVMGSKASRRDLVADEGRQIRAQLAGTKEFSKAALCLQLNVWRLGPISLAALPFEIYSDTGEFLWERVHVVPICYANGYWGYLPSATAAPDDYEALSSPFNLAADTLLRQSVQSMLD